MFHFRFTTHIFAPERIVNARYVDGEQRQRDAEQIEGEEALVVAFGATGERVIDGREHHAELPDRHE